MKATLFLFILTGVLLQSPVGISQTLAPVTGGAVEIPRNSEPCVSETQRAAIHQMISDNISMLQSQGKLLANYSEGNHPLFIWPIAQADGFDYEQNWALINYVDHNPTVPNQIEDYDCGTRSYDTTSGYNHQGFDINPWPFWWKQMDDNQAINVAAADGQIIGKDDGSYDKNCGFNNDPWNAVYIQHSDGSVSWYGHMKEGTLTSKTVGESVTQGEFLGVIGSSGSSTNPHIHFEVYDSNNNLIDPSIGPCNSLNVDSWWIDQKNYYEPKINTLLSHSAFPVFPTCPETEQPNLQNQFDTGEEALLAVYLTEQVVNSSLALRTIRPDGTTQFSWNFDLTDNLAISYWAWNILPDMDGEWTFEVSYMGQTVTHNYNVGVLANNDESLANTIIYPNPVEETLHITSELPIEEIELRDMQGRLVVLEKSNKLKEINTISLPQGVYFVTLKSGNLLKTHKIVKQ